MNMNSITKKLNRYSNKELKELIKKLNLSQRNHLYNALIFNYALTDIKRTIDNDPEFYNDFTEDDIVNCAKKCADNQFVDSQISYWDTIMCVLSAYKK